jgi:ferric-dicitrate binding protein FerR (iron transport regulator)
MNLERLLQLLARQMGHAASDEEIAELKELLSRHPEYHYFIEVLQAIAGERKHYEPATGEDDLVRESWCMLQHELDVPSLSLNDEIQNVDLLQVYERGTADENGMRLRRSSAKWIRWAAIWIGVFLIAGGSFYLWRGTKSNQALPLTAKINRVAVPYGAPKKELLPDSSVVWLNAASHIRYSDNFVQKTRDVYLDGEAYFNIKQDKNHPFIVHAGNIAIKVLGTEFNVEAYRDENKIETTLIKGKIQVQIAGKPDQKIILTPHEKLTVINQELKLPGKRIKDKKELSFQVKEVIPLRTATPIPEVAWLQDKLAFQNEPFSVLAKKLERRYDVHIIFRDTLLEDERLSGVFENETIQKALKILQMTTPFAYNVQGDTVYIKQ